MGCLQLEGLQLKDVDVCRCRRCDSLSGADIDGVVNTLERYREFEKPQQQKQKYQEHQYQQEEHICSFFTPAEMALDSISTAV